MEVKVNKLHVLPTDVRNQRSLESAMLRSHNQLLGPVIGDKIELPSLP